MLLCSFLQSLGVELRIAPAVVRQSWPLWLQMLAITADTFEPGVILPASKQFFLGVTVAVGMPPVFACELGLDATHEKLARLTANDRGDWLPPVGASLSGALHQSHTNEKETGVLLPRFKNGRFTPTIGDPGVERLFAEVSNYEKLRNLSFE